MTNSINRNQKFQKHHKKPLIKKVELMFPHIKSSPGSNPVSRSSTSIIRKLQQLNQLSRKINYQKTPFFVKFNLVEKIIQVNSIINK